MGEFTLFGSHPFFLVIALHILHKNVCTFSSHTHLHSLTRSIVRSLARSLVGWGGVCVAMYLLWCGTEEFPSEEDTRI